MESLQFEDALKAMKEGKKVYRNSWRGFYNDYSRRPPSEYVQVVNYGCLDEHLFFEKCQILPNKEVVTRRWNPNGVEHFANDWFILEEES